MLTINRKRVPIFHTGQKFNAIINGVKCSGHVYVNSEGQPILCQNKKDGGGIYFTRDKINQTSFDLNLGYKFGWSIRPKDMACQLSHCCPVSFLRLNGVDEEFIKKVKAEETRIANKITDQNEKRKKRDELLEKAFDKYHFHPFFDPRPETFIKIIEELIDLKAELEKVKEELKNKTFSTSNQNY